MVVSGAPLPNQRHALQMSDMALDMLDAVQSVVNPAADSDHIEIKIGKQGVLYFGVCLCLYVAVLVSK